jgi:hypothetical protein
MDLKQFLKEIPVQRRVPRKQFNWDVLLPPRTAQPEIEEG